MTVTLQATSGIRTYYGLAADTKPTTNTPIGSKFFEIDTGTTYIFYGVGWASFSSGGGGGSISSTQLPAVLGPGVQAGALLTTLATDQPSIGVIPDPTEGHIGSVGSNTSRIYINPTITAGAYSAGDVVGGRLTLTNWARVSALGTRLLGIHVVDVGNIKADLDFLLFDSLPVTNLADNAVWSENSADYAHEVMHFSILATEYTSVGGVARCSKSLSNFPILPSGSANAYLYIVCRGTPTYASTSGLHISFGPDRD